MNPDKAKLRKKLRSIRLFMSAEEVEIKSKAIGDKLIDGVEWADIKNMHIYTPVPGWNEVDTAPLIRSIEQEWPRIDITSPAPDKDEPFPAKKYDLIIVPLLGFDEQRYRLGNGGGWYDRWLASQPQAMTVGLAYSFSKLKNLPHEPHDVPLKRIITEVDII